MWIIDGLHNWRADNRRSTLYILVLSYSQIRRRYSECFRCERSGL